ncbi:MAG: hypothetical protein JJU31_15675 [Wenzhouxiangella sp.]|nr:hypothetical protein [Wenzhouxiangella sp.]
MKARWCFVIVFYLFSMPMAQADGPNAWWIICDTCITEDDFRNVAPEAPLDGIVFVSNGESGVSHKFERSTLIEDAPGAIIVTILISDLPMPEWQAAVFNEALESARTYLVGMPRDSIPMLDPVGSVVDDVFNGQLRADFVQWLQFELISRGHFPDVQSVSSEAGATVRGIAFRGGQSSNQARTRPLLVRVSYPDGSKVTLTLSPDAQSILAVTMTDADGNVLPTLGVGGSLALDREGFMGREFLFGSPVDELLNWLNMAGSSGHTECRGEITDDGRVQVICRRP